jgi:hypothetical protein
MTTQKENRPTQGEAVQDIVASQAKERPDVTVSQPADTPVNDSPLDGEVNDLPPNGERPKGERATGASARNLFDPDYSVGDDENPDLGPAVISIPIRKPNPAKYFRTHPEWVRDRHVLEITEGMDKYVYLISDELIHLAEEHVRKVRIYPYINRHRTVSLWVVNFPREGRKLGRKAFDTAVRAADNAKTVWTKVWWNSDTASYDYRPARVDLGEPVWPDLTHGEMYEIAFEGLAIDHPGHEVLRQLWGEE